MNFRFRLVDLREFDGEPFPGSDAVNDQILSRRRS